MTSPRMPGSRPAARRAEKPLCAVATVVGTHLVAVQNGGAAGVLAGLIVRWHLAVTRRAAAAAGPPVQPCAVHPHPGDAPAQLARPAGPPGRTGLAPAPGHQFPGRF